MECRNEDEVCRVLVELGYAAKVEAGIVHTDANYGPNGAMTFQLMWSHLPASGNREYLTHRICFRDRSGRGIYALESHDVRISKQIPGLGGGARTADLTFHAGTGEVPDIKGAYVRVRKRLQEVIYAHRSAIKKLEKKAVGTRQTKRKL